MANALPYPADPRWQRLLALVAFGALLYAFRSLAAVLVFFVLFERTLGAGAAWLSRRARLGPKAALGALLAALFGTLGLGVFVGVRRIIDFVDLARRDGPAWLEALSRSGLVQWAQANLGLDAHALVERAGAYAGHAMGYLGATAYLTLYVFIGFVVALMYLFERDEVDAWVRSISSHSLQGTLIRWLGHVADAIGITLRLQVVVALFNAVFTLPLLLLLGLPNIPLLCLLVLLGGMIPVVGGALSGLVLCLVAYDAQGFVGVAVFLAVTFVLGKVESYYLSPRLTAEHVQLPGLILVVSLLMFETLFGFWGLFMSFPALYVGLQISREFSTSPPSRGSHPTSPEAGAR